MANRANITPLVFKWARESARISLEKAATKISVDPKKLNEWEEGISKPTIKQAETLAKAYKRPFAIFFLSDVPRDFQPLKDFRSKTAKPLGTASIFIIRELQQKHSWISDVLQDSGEVPLSFVGKFSIDSDIQQIANDIIDTLNIDPQNYLTNDPYKEWIDKAESKGIFISRSSFINTKMKIDVNEIQGFSIADKYAPFVFVNSNDWKTSQLFTVVHELVHIWINESGISNEIEPQIQFNDKLDPIELFCNDVAANVLMPNSVMKNLSRSVFNSSQEIFDISKKMGISSFALLVRAFKLQLISLELYNKLKRIIDNEFLAYLKQEEEKKAKQKEKSGGPNPYLLLLNKNSHMFTQIVIDAFRGGVIEPTQASRLLNTQVDKFPRFELFLYK